MPIDINSLRTYKGGDPDAYRLYMTQRYKDPTLGALRRRPVPVPLSRRKIQSRPERNGTGMAVACLLFFAGWTRGGV